MTSAARVMSRTQFAYVLCATSGLVSSLVYMTFCICIPCHNVAATQKQDKQEVSGVIPPRHKIFVWVGSSIFAFFVVGLDSCIYNLLTVYAIVGIPAHLDQASASLLTAFYWSCIMIGRLVLGPACCTKSTQTKGVTCISLAMVAAAILSIGAPYSLPLVCLTYGVLGLAVGPLLPLMLSHADSNVNFSGWFLSSTLVCGEFGRFIVPLSVATEMARRSSGDLPFAQLVLLLGTALSYAFLARVVKSASHIQAVSNLSATLEGDAPSKIAVNADDEDDLFDLQDVGLYSPKRTERTAPDGAFDAYFSDKNK